MSDATNIVQSVKKILDGGHIPCLQFASDVCVNGQLGRVVNRGLGLLLWCLPESRAEYDFHPSVVDPPTTEAHGFLTKGSRKNNFAELALGLGSGLADPREQNHRNSELFRGFCE